MNEYNSQLLIMFLALCIACFCLLCFFMTRYVQRSHQLSLRLQHYSHEQKRPFRWQSLLTVLPVTEKDRKTLGLLLMRAGFRQPEAIFILVAVKLVGLIVLPMLIFLQHSGDINITLLAKCTTAGLVGSMAAEWWVTMRANKNQETMQAAMPDAVDLMVICAESGLHLDAILRTVGEDIQDWSLQLSDELLFTCAQLNLGMNRSEALTNFSERLATEEAKHLVSALIQSDRYGTPLVKTLKDLACDIRRIRGLKIEEKMGKVPATMSLPLMVFVLMPLVVLLAGPALISVIRSLQGN